jgi:hypothetical protein
MRLWVTAVSPDCVATYAYGSGPLPPNFSNFKTARIQDGVLSISCGGGGTCNFKQAGDSLEGTYTGPFGDNSGVFKKILIDTK